MDQCADNYLIAIDDKADLLEIIARVAKETGFTAATTTDPDEFKTLVQTKNPSVILLDLQMPGCDGIELMRFLFEQQCRAHIVLVSGVDSKIINVASNVGAQFGLQMAPPMQKPLRVADLRIALSGLTAKQCRVDGEMVRHALANDEITLYFQPLINLRDNRLIGWEALARWHHPELGTIMPDKFIPIVEQEGLIDRLTDHVLSLATRQLGEWHRSGDPRLANSFVSVNFTAANLADAQLPDRLEQLCLQQQIPCDLLRLELTESAAMSGSVRFVETLTRLRVKGFKLAIDDFGTGYSSLVQLYRLPFSELKIDQMFVRNMQASAEAAIIVGAIIDLARALHLELIAEGVETEDVATRLAASGCHIAQGYHFARPMSGYAVSGWCEMNSHLMGP